MSGMLGKTNPLLYGGFLIAGVYVFFLGYGVAQENVYKYGNRATGDHFHYSFFLTFCFCLANTLVSLTILLFQPHAMKRVQAMPRTIYYQLGLSSLTYVASMLATNYALRHVSYPTQIIVKSIKMVPVTIGGFVFFGRRYPWYDYVAVASVTAALTVFNFLKAGGSGSGAATQSTLGLALLGVSLFCDSVTGPRQDNLIKQNRSLKPIEMMFITNLFAIIITGTITIAVEGTGAFVFCLMHPTVIRHVVTFALCGAFGQIFIFNCLTTFGSLHLSLITTTRKFFTVLLSVLLFGHHISPMQWVCVAVIFGALTAQSYYSKTSKSAKVDLAKVSEGEKKENRKPGYVGAESHHLKTS